MAMRCDDLNVAIVLPAGRVLGGVTVWAERTASRLAARGARVALLVHEDERGAGDIDPRVRVVALRSPAPMDDGRATHSAVVEEYRGIMDGDGWHHRGPVVLCPQTSGACFAACIASCSGGRRAGRVVGWLHSDFGYDHAMLGVFEAGISRFAAVGGSVGATLAGGLGQRSADVRTVHHGVEAGPARGARGRGPVRLVYAGRLDLGDKRAGALVEMSRELQARGVAHDLSLVGSGPGRDVLMHRASGLPARILGPSADATRLMRDADVFVLASRREGAGLALMEAMGQGCAGVVAGCAAGAREIIGASGGGAVCDIGEHDDDAAAGRMLAGGVERVIEAGVRELGERGRTWIARERSVDQCTDATIAVLAEAARDAREPRLAPSWRPDRPWTVPADAAERVALAIGRAQGAVLLWGGGAHTAVVLGELGDAARARIRGIVDDDPSRHGLRVCGVPVVGARSASGLGARVVIISSWLHERSMWDRRAELEQRGLAVERVYGAGANGGVRRGGSAAGGAVEARAA